MNPILEVRHLSISFLQYESGFRRRMLTVIRDLSLTVLPGEIVAVVGSSGSGKSLLAHGILGLLPYNASMQGSILYDGTPLDPARAARLRGKEISLVPQGVNYLDPLMTVGAQLRKGERGAEIKKRCREVLARYGLKEETQSLYPFELSGGMARRVLISSAVLQSPRLILADEPTPGLDAQSAGRILGHFREMAKGGAGVLFITHDLDLALTVSNRVVVLYAGETVEEASASDFASGKLRHPYTQALWKALPCGEFTAVSGAQPYPGEIEQGCLFAPRCPHCRAQCTSGEIPYHPAGNGWVRCLLSPQEEE